ncbi:MAG: rRNA biogenesis protein rrp5, partial [Lachnospiraceae bacterium]|nr:rRNA biogenesis protein rrp5 [Lachnospiraceae bacterium]
MSRIKLMLDVVNDLEELTGSLKTLVQAMKADETEVAEDKTADTPDEKKEQETDKAKEPIEEAKPEVKNYTLEDVRQALSEKSGAGYTAEVKALLERHGGSKLS